MKIVISSGHGKYIRGASGYPVPPQLDEVDEARQVTEAVAELMRAAGVEVKTFHDDTSHDQSTNLATIVNYHNAQDRDLDVSVHFNAYDGSAHGVEVLYVSQSSLASKVSSAIAAAGPFTNRGAKYRGDLYFLNNTEEPAILLEVCFCDNSGDSNTYRANFERICEAIAESVTGEEVPSEPPVDLPPGELPPEENYVEITVAARGNVAVVANGETHIVGTPVCTDRVLMNLAALGNVHVVVNGEDFHGSAAPPTEEENDDGIPANQKNITATVFGGEADGEFSAYPPYDSQGRGEYLNDTDLYVSLPANITDAEVRERGVRVFTANDELSAIGEIRDKGPWLVDDEDYVFGDARPLAETCNHNGTPLPRGPNKGQVPSNDAGIDLSPALAEMLGIDGKGKVHWKFVDADEA